MHVLDRQPPLLGAGDQRAQPSPTSALACRWGAGICGQAWASDDSDGLSDCGHAIHRLATSSTEFSEPAMWTSDFLLGRSDSWHGCDWDFGDDLCDADSVADSGDVCGVFDAEVGAEPQGPPSADPPVAAGALPVFLQTGPLLEILEEELPSCVACASAPALAGTCRSMRSRFRGDFWQRRIAALPDEVLWEAGLVDELRARHFGTEPSASPATFSTPRLPAGRIAALEARSLASPQEQAQLDRLLCCAAQRGADCWRLLLSGAQPNCRSGCSPALGLAVASGSIRTVRQLLFHGARIEAVDINGDRPLVVAILHQHVEVLRLLLASGACPDEPDGHGDTPLICATVSGQVDMVEALVEGGADVEASDLEGDTPLVCAAMNGCAEVIPALVRAGAEVDAPHDAGGDVPLIRAVAGGHLASVRALLDCRARLDARSTRGQSAFEVAKANGHREVLEVLMRARRALGDA